LVTDPKAQLASGTFKAQSKDDADLLYEIKANFGGAFDVVSIQSAYDMFRDPVLVWQLLREISMLTRGVEYIKEPASVSGYVSAVQTMLEEAKTSPQKFKSS